MSSLDERRRAGKRARRRGANGELEVRDLLRAHGWTDSHRQFQSGGQGGGDLADAIPDVHVEVKFTEKLRLREAFRQAKASARPTDTVVVAHRASNQPWLASLRLTDWMPLAPAPTVVVVIGVRESLRAQMLMLLKRSERPAVVHQLDTACVTVLLVDLLVLLARAEADEAVFRR